MKRIRLFLWALVGIALVAVVAIRLTPASESPLAAAQGPDTETVSAEFELTDPSGSVRTDDEFRGRWMLVFFGFTNCPDVCPTGLSTIASAMDALGDGAAGVQPIFVTVDPERDDPSRLAEYLAFFGDGIVGLRGTPEQLERTAGAFKVYYERIEDEGAPDGYTMGHTPSLLLFDETGAFVRTFGHDAAPQEIADDLRERMGA